MRLAQVVEGTVANVIEVDPLAVPDWAADWPEAVEAGIGWSWDGAEFTPPPAPEPEPVPVPEVVSRFQAREALRGAGLLAAVELLVAGADGLTQRAWDEVTEFRRASPLLNGLAAQLDPPLSQEELDDLFRAAAQVLV